MSISVCFKCGTTKLEPACPCTKCRTTPASEDELAVSMALTDTLMSNDELHDIAGTIAAGKPYKLEPELRTRMIVALRKSGRFSKAKRATDINDQGKVKRHPWWRLFG